MLATFLLQAFFVFNQKGEVRDRSGRLNRPLFVPRLTQTISPR